MAQVSKYPISKEIYERIFDIFLKTLYSLKTKQSFSYFLLEFLTPTEQVMLAKRLAIAFLLTKKYDYRAISKILKVSVSTIGFIASDLKDGENYKKVINKILKDEKIEQFFLEVGEKFTSMLSQPNSKSSAWRYLRDEIRVKKNSKPF